jgi:hypothetical protein
MGGQACVLYGGAEFSRDTDVVLLGDDQNLERLRAAVDALQAETIAVPPFERQYLEEGLAVHFRCRHPEAAGMRLDVMTRLRGVALFDELWSRRTTIDWEGEEIALLSLPDLVQAKKTQRDKDWVMIRRLVETNYAEHGASPLPQQVEYWFRELRTAPLLIELARRFPAECRQLTVERPLLAQAVDGDIAALDAALRDEEMQEREADRRYWAPLRQRLEDLRRKRPHN